jgi:hypothetical protein
MITVWVACVGQKGEKFCSKCKQGTGTFDTCGTSFHAKKAMIETDHISFWDNHLKVHGCYLEPLLAMTFSLAEPLRNAL